MAEIYRIISVALGVPPRADEKFTWDYYDANDKVRRWEGTPIEFYKAGLFLLCISVNVAYHLPSF